jgi:hypothetical protein
MKRSAALFAIAYVVFSVESAAQTTASDPWRRVPALPTSCLADGFTESVGTIHESVKTELASVKETNDKLAQDYGAMDMQEKMRRMQAFMARDPQQAMKVMQAMQSAATATTDDLTSADAANTELTAQLEELTAAFKEASLASAKPFQTRQSQMIDAKTSPYAGGNRFKSKADQDAFMDLLKQEDAAYEKACVPFFGTGGKFHTWLNDYRTKVAMKVASGTDANEGTIASQMAIMDSPGSGYRMTGQLVGVRNYLEQIRKVYELRYGNARPPMDLILIK